MALTLPGMTACSLCGATLQKDEPLVAFPAFIADREDPLWRYSDSAMHECCFEAWEQRDAMIDKYNRACSDLFGAPEQTKKTQVAILGLPEERASIFDLLKRSAEDSPDKA